MLSLFEEILWYVTIPLVALFAHPRYTYEFSTPKYAILTVAVFLVGIYLFFKLLREKTFKFFATPVHWAWLAFSIVALLSTVNTYKDNPFYFRQAIDIGLYLLLNVLISFYISTKIGKKDQIVRFLFIFVLTGLVISINAILNFYMGIDIFLGKIGTPFDRTSIKANIGNVIFVANYLNMIFPIALYFVISFDIGLLESKKFLSIFFFKITSLIAALLSFAVVILSQTRSEYIALIIEMLLFAFFYLVYLKNKEDRIQQQLKEKLPKLYKKLSALRTISTSVMVLLLLFIFVSYVVPSPLNRYGAIRATERFQTEEFVASKDVRVLSWLSNIYIWKRHKILGQGIGTYQVYGLFGISDLINEKPEYSYAWSNFKRAHNDYFQVLSETGILGILSILTMLVFLIIFVFKNVGKIEEKDDLLFFLMLVLSGIVFAIQSFFSFPGHLLPNALLANFVISFGLGKYFNKSMGKEFIVKGRKALLIASVLLIAVFLSMYLRWNHFVSEVYFRDGNVAFNTLVYLKQEESKIDYYLKQIESLEKDLNDYTGQFESLDPVKWHNVKEAQAKQSGVPYNRIQSEAERQRTILSYKNQIASQKQYLISQKNNIPGELMKQYTLAKESFLKSVRLNHTYGKSYFYLAALATEPIRIQELYNLLKKDPESVLSQNGDDIQKIIPKKYRYAFYEPLSDLVKENPAILEKINLADIQGLVDSLSIYELSLNTFTERNTFKAIAMRYHSLYQANSYLLNNINNSEIERKIYGYFALFFNGFANWARKTVNLVPGGWNRFTDWKHYDIERAMNGEDIYRYFATAAVTIRDPVNVESRELLIDLAQKEIITSINMELKNAWGVPDGVLDYLHALAREYQVIGEYQESVYTYDEILMRYKEIYEMLRKKVNNHAILKNKFKQFVEKFQQSFDSVLKKEDKDFLTTNFTPLIINNLNGTFDKFISSDFKTAEKDFQQELDRLTPSLWSGLRKVSIWKALAKETIKYPMSQLQYLKLSDEAIMTIQNLLDSVVNLKFMLMYERYARFTNHYELIKDEAVKTIEELIRRYEDESEDKILADWSEVSFNAPKFNSKQEVLTFLNNTLKKYKQ